MELLGMEDGRVRKVCCLSLFAALSLASFTARGAERDAEPKPETVAQKDVAKQVQAPEPDKANMPAASSKSAASFFPAPSSVTSRVRVRFSRESLNSFDNRLSYAAGKNIGDLMKKQEVALGMAMFRKGLDDAMFGRTGAYSPDDVTAIYNDFRASRQAWLNQKREAKFRGSSAAQEQQKKEADQDRLAAKIFLEENKRKQGVVELPSGLQYRVLREGTGASPKTTSRVRIQFRETHMDGEEIRSSYTRPRPPVVTVRDIKRSWAEALVGMKEGAKWEIYIPPDFETNAPSDADVLRGGVRICELELVEIVK
jgi:FKBP-type peptidyl-prolyl cis-trans isomerase FklB